MYEETLRKIQEKFGQELKETWKKLEKNVKYN